LSREAPAGGGGAERPSGLAAWYLAARPKTLPAAASGVLVATALAWLDGRFAAGPAAAAFAIALLLQIGSNLANDVYDAERGADTAERLGPARATQSGWLTRAQVKRGMAVVFGVAFALGLYLTWVRGWLVLAIGCAAIVSAIAYTGGTYPLGYHGLGEVFVFIFFGPVAVVGTYWVQSGEAPFAAWVASVAIGLLVTAILVVNNLRDIEQDRAAGKRTITVRIGTRATMYEWVLFVASAYLIVVGAVALGLYDPGALAVLVSIPLAVRTARIVFNEVGTALNRALAMTGQLALAFGALFSAGVIVGGSLF
jgi:1,4-dihydroxy-2-naphthoate octaprenyltransferase